MSGISLGLMISKRITTSINQNVLFLGNYFYGGRFERLLFAPSYRKYKDMQRSSKHHYEKHQKDLNKQMQVHPVPKYEQVQGGQHHPDQQKTEVVDDEFLKRLQTQVSKKHQSQPSKQFDIKKNKFKFSTLKYTILNNKINYTFSHYKHRRSSPYDPSDPQNTSLKTNLNQIRKQFTKDQQIKDNVNKIEVKNPGSDKKYNETKKVSESNPNERLNYLQRSGSITTQGKVKFSTDNKEKNNQKVVGSCEMKLDNFKKDKNDQIINQAIKEQNNPKYFHNNNIKEQPSQNQHLQFYQNDISKYELEKIKKYQNEQKSNPIDQQPNQHKNSVNRGQKVMKKNNKNKEENNYKSSQVNPGQILKDLKKSSQKLSPQQQSGQFHHPFGSPNRFRLSLSFKPPSNRQQISNKDHGQSSTTNKQKKNERKTPMDQNSGQQDKHLNKQKYRTYDTSYRQTKQKQIKWQKQHNNTDILTSTKTRLQQLKDEQKQQKKNKSSSSDRLTKQSEQNISQTNRSKYKFSQYKHSYTYNHPQQNSVVNHSHNKNWQHSTSTQPNKVDNYNVQHLRKYMQSHLTPEEQYKEVPNTTTCEMTPNMRSVPPEDYRQDVIGGSNK